MSCTLEKPSDLSLNNANMKPGITSEHDDMTLEGIFSLCRQDKDAPFDFQLHGFWRNPEKKSWLGSKAYLTFFLISNSTEELSKAFPLVWIHRKLKRVLSHKKKIFIHNKKEIVLFSFLLLYALVVSTLFILLKLILFYIPTSQYEKMPELSRVMRQFG